MLGVVDRAPAGVPSTEPVSSGGPVSDTSRWLAPAADEPSAAASPDAPAGHWTVPGPRADRVEAWAPTRLGCVAEAVAGVIEAFADVGDQQPSRYHRVILPGREDPEVLRAVLDEVLYDVRSVGVLPVWISLRSRPEGAELEIGGIDTDEVRAPQRAPVRVSLHRLARRPGSREWTASVVLRR